MFTSHMKAAQKSSKPSDRQLRRVSLYHSLQAKSWLGWEFAASSGRTEHLQWWNGSAWQQSSFPARSSDQPAPNPAANAGQRHQNGAQASASAPDTSSSASQPSSSNSDKSAAANTATPAAMSSFTSQALLECHYSKHHAFLQDAPLLQVCFGLASMLNCGHPCLGDIVDIYYRECFNHLSRARSDSVCLHSVCQCSLSIVCSWINSACPLRARGILQACRLLELSDIRYSQASCHT